MLYFSLYRATNAANAFAEAKKIALDSLEANEEIDEGLFESAKPSLIFELIEKEKTVGDVVFQSLVAFFKQTDRQFQQEFFKKISAVTKEEMKSAAIKYIRKDKFKVKEIGMEINLQNNAQQNLYLYNYIY